MSYEDHLDLCAWLDKRFSGIDKRIARLEDVNRAGLWSREIGRLAGFDLSELTKGGASQGYELICCHCGRTPNNHDDKGVCFELGATP